MKPLDRDSRTALFVWAACAETELLRKEMLPYPVPGNLYQEEIKKELIRRGMFFPL